MREESRNLSNSDKNINIAKISTKATEWSQRTKSSKIVVVCNATKVKAIAKEKVDSL